MFYNETMKTIRGLLLLSFEAKRYFAALLSSSGDGAQSTRPELIHAKSLQ